MSKILEVPLEADGEVLTIDLTNDLPEDPSEICVLLENEKSAAQYWLAFGSAYAEKNQNSSAIEVVSQGLNAPIIQSEADKAPFYTSLCWLYLRQLRQSPANERERLYNIAIEYSNKALQIDRLSIPATLSRGVLALSKGAFDDSLPSFQSIIAQSQDTNVFAKLGRARILYHRKNYRGALKLYQAVLSARPDTKPDPRIGIGLCFWRIGDKPHALKAWERVLSREPHSVTANSLLGIYHLDRALHEPHSREEFEHLFTTAINYMQTAYNESPANPPGHTASLASMTIASYLFSRGQVDSVVKLADKVLEYSRLPALLSDAYFWKGRVADLQGNLEAALDAYRKAVEMNKSNVLAALGRGIIELRQESPEALLTFETISSNHPNSSIALLYAGIVYASRAGTDQKRIQKAIGILERYAGIKKAARETIVPEVYLLLAQLHEKTNVIPPQKALEYTEQGIAALVDQGGQEPTSLSAALHNNRGVLAYFCGKFDEAQASFATALESKDASDYEATVKFNRARLEDAVGRPDEARQGYQEVLDLVPAHVDSMLRKAYLDVVLGDGAMGDIAMGKLMHKHDDSLEARALYGWFIRRTIRTKGPKAVPETQEQKLYKYSLMDVDKHDTYSLVAMGNIYLQNAREIRIKKPADAERKDKAYFKASEFFDKALQIDPHNAYAAQGIAIILAETMRSRNALQIFSRVREAIDDASVDVNTGHTLMDLKDYDQAVQMYERAITKTSGSDATLYSLVGRAWYAKGVTQKNVEFLENSLKASKKALEILPENLSLQFNVAFMQFQIADVIRRLPIDKRTVDQIESASEGLNEAIRILRELSKAPNPPFAATDLDHRSELGENTILPQLQQALDEQKAHEAQAETKLEAARGVLRETKAKEEAELKRKRDEVELREQQLAEQRKQLEEQAAEWEKERASSEVATASAEPERKRHKADDDFIVDDPEDDDEDADASMPDAPTPPSEHDEEEPIQNGQNGDGKSRRAVVDDDDDDDEDEAEKNDDGLDGLF